jgi:hypothetical protein
MAWTSPGTSYQTWQHTVTREYWIVRVEYNAITGVFGPLDRRGPVAEPGNLLFEDHPDDLEWFIRYSDSFEVVN